MSNPNWVDALSADELPSDDVIGVVVDGRDIALYTVCLLYTSPSPRD